MTFALSIIIPTLNEEDVIDRCLDPLQYKKDCEVIIVDGGSSDTTLDLARKYGCRIIASPKGRGKQMNHGAREAQGDVLLFLHADTILPEDFPELILETVSRSGFAAGAFSLAINSPLKSLATIAYLANLRSRFLKLPYGDQALFTTRGMFNAIKGFPEIEIMEDYVFMGKIKKEGEIIILPEEATTSARRWHNIGILQTTLINQIIICGYKLGIAPVTLDRWYRRMRGVNKN